MPRTANDFERLATVFRPSWELDDAPFTGERTLSASDIQALQGSAPNAEVRAATAQALNATPVPSKPVATPEPLASVIIDRTLAPIAAPQAVPPPPLCEMPMSRPAHAPAPWAAAPSQEPQPHPPARAPESTHTPIGPPARGRAPALDAESSASFVLPSKRPLWIGAGVIVVVLAGAGVWATSGGKEKPTPALEAAAKPVDNAKLFAIPPPPPPETQAIAPPAPVVPAQTPVLTVAAVAALPMTPPAAVPPPVVAHAVTATQLAVRSASTAPARHLARKGPSIVRDVPF
jgi:hypothetical protein